MVILGDRKRSPARYGWTELLQCAKGTRLLFVQIDFGQPNVKHNEHSTRQDAEMIDLTTRQQLVFCDVQDAAWGQLKHKMVKAFDQDQENGDGNRRDRDENGPLDECADQNRQADDVENPQTVHQKK